MFLRRNINILTASRFFAQNRIPRETLISRCLASSHTPSESTCHNGTTNAHGQRCGALARHGPCPGVCGDDLCLPHAWLGQPCRFGESTAHVLCRWCATEGTDGSSRSRCGSGKDAGRAGHSKCDNEKVNARTTRSTTRSQPSLCGRLLYHG